MGDKFERTMMMMGLIGLILAGSVVFSFLGLKASIEGMTIGRQESPVCLWQISGSGKDINHLMSDTDSCARLFERYSGEGECSDETGILIVNDAKGNQISWSYDTSCSKLVGGKRFTVLKGKEA